MKIRVFSIDFRAEGGIVYPVDSRLHKLAVEFTAQELAKPVNLADFKKLWACCEADDEDQPVRVTGLLGMVLKPDFPLARFTHPSAAKSLIDRAQDYLQDQGARGAEYFVLIAEREDDLQRCPQHMDWLKYIGARPAERWAAMVK